MNALSPLKGAGRLGRPMTPEALCTYLLVRGFEEDVVQDVIVDFLTTSVLIRYPKAWGWKAAQRYAAARRRTQSRHVSLDLVPAREVLPEGLVDTHTLNPEWRAEVREALAQAFHQGPPKQKRGRPRNGGFEGCREDYEALIQRESLHDLPVLQPYSIYQGGY